MSTIKVDTIATRTGSGNITVSNNIAGGGTISGTNITASGTLGVTGNSTVGGTLGVTGIATFTAQSVHTGGIQAGGNISNKLPVIKDEFVDEYPDRARPDGFEFNKIQDNLRGMYIPEYKTDET